MSLMSVVVKGHKVLSQLPSCYQKVQVHTLARGGSCLGILSSEKCVKLTLKASTTTQTQDLVRFSKLGYYRGRPLSYGGHRFSLVKCHAVPTTRTCPLSTAAAICQQEKPSHEHKVEDNEPKNHKYQYKTWKVLLTVPNVLTLSRVLLTPYLGYLVLCESYPAACGLFLFAGITDVLDGWIARQYPSQATPVGSFMDPLADKFLISTLFITLSIVNLIPAPLTFLVVLRDVSLIVAAFYVRIISLQPPITLASVFDLTNQTAELKPTLISKANTGVQLGLVVLTLVAPLVNCVDHPVLQALWCVTAVMTLWSGIGYIYTKDTFTVYKRRLKQKQS